VGNKQYTMKFTAKTDCTLLELILVHHPGMSNSKAKKMIENYMVKCRDSILKRPVDAVLKGQTIEFLQKEAIKTVKVDDFKLRIVYEDKWLIVAHKPFGIVSSGDTLKEGQTLFTQIRSYLRSKYGMREQLFVVHRLDKAVEGLIMFARLEAVKEKLQENWKQINKYYVAKTTAIPAKKSGTIHSWLREEEHMKMVSYEQEVPDSKEAITHYRVIKTMGQHALIEIKLETGRKNQIRIHLSSIGCPILGDRRYNDDDRTVKAIKLLSYKLEFEHPGTKQLMKFNLPIPKSFESKGK